MNTCDKNLTCPAAIRFIKGLYTFLREKRVCFLNGAFVMSDPYGKLYDTLKKCPSQQDRDSVAGLITHELFLKESQFEKLKPITSNVVLDTRFASQQHTFKKNKVFDDYTLFEINLYDCQDDELRRGLSYLCDNQCMNQENQQNKENQENQQNKENQDEHCQNNKETKRIILMYPFQVIDDGIKKRYLYFKLESYPVKSLDHVEEWFSLARKTTYPLRREDKPRSSKTKELDYAQNSSLFVQDSLLSIDLKAMNDNEELAYYNQHLRMHREMFIPSAVINRIMPELHILEPYQGRKKRHSKRHQKRHSKRHQKRHSKRHQKRNRTNKKK